MEVVEYGYVVYKSIASVAYFPRWRPKLTPKIRIRCISALRSGTKTSHECRVYSYKLEDVEFQLWKKSNSDHIMTKMAAKMAAENPILVYLNYDCRF